MPPRLRIGLTGGIASGKSTVAQRFTELGIAVIDADESSRFVVAPGRPGLDKIVDRFGSSILTSAGELDRRALRALVFADADKRRDLEAILHPLIRADMQERAMQAVGPYVVLAIPLLVEGGSRDRVNRVLVVDAEEALQLKRLMARDCVTPAEAHAMLDAQANRESRLKAADDVIRNSGTIEELREAVDRLHERYLRLADAMSA